LLDASIGGFDKNYDVTYTNFNFDISEFAAPLAGTGVLLILTSVLGFVLA